MLWHSLNQCWLIITSSVRSSDYYLSDLLYGCDEYNLKKKVKLDLISFSMWINQSLNFDWFISQKVSVIGKSNVTWLFAKFQVHLVQISYIVNMTKLNSCAFGAHNLFKSIWCASGSSSSSSCLFKKNISNGGTNNAHDIEKKNTQIISQQYSEPWQNIIK